MKNVYFVKAVNNVPCCSSFKNAEQPQISIFLAKILKSSQKGNGL